MINILHLYYDLLNLYGENANTRCLVHNLELNNIKVHVDLKSINDKIDLSKYDIIYIGQGSEDNLELARTDILNRKEEFKKYIESNKLLLLTGNSMDLFGSYIEANGEKLETLDIFDYYTKLSNSFDFKNASTDRIVGEITCTTTLIKEKIIGASNNNIKKVILPKENEKDVEVLDEVIKKNIKFVYVSNYEEVLKEIKL